MFLIEHDLTVWSMPFDESSTAWHKVLLTQGMRITQIGPKDSEENQKLQNGVALHPVELPLVAFSPLNSWKRGWGAA